MTSAHVDLSDLSSLGMSAFCLKFSGSDDCSNNATVIYYIGAVHGNDSRTLELISGLP